MEDTIRHSPTRMNPLRRIREPLHAPMSHSAVLTQYLQDCETKARKKLLRQRKREDAEFKRVAREQSHLLTEQGKLWKEYDELFRQLRREDEDNHTETAHMTQDEIYRKFITDIVGGRFRTQAEIRAMALLMKLNVVDFDKPGRWWYA